MHETREGQSFGPAGVLSPVNGMRWLKRVWLAALFLLLCGASFFAFPFGGLTITVGRVCLLMFLYLFLLAFFLHQGRLDVRIEVGKYVLFFGLWLFWALLSLFWADATVNSARHVEAIVVGTAMVGFSLLFLSHGQGIGNLCGVWVTAAGAFIVIGIWEVATGMHLGGSREGQWAGVAETYACAVFWNPNDFATFLCLAMPFVSGLLQMLKKPLPKAVAAVSLLAGFYFIVLNSSRANIVACLMGVGLVLLLPGAIRRWKSTAVVVAVAAALLVAGYVFFASTMASQLDILKTLPQQVGSIDARDASTAVRMGLVRNGWAFLQQSHYLGIGAGGFEQWMTERPVYYTGGIVNAHNFWLEMLVDYGAVVFVLFLGFYLGLLRALFRVFRASEDPMLRSMSLAAFISLVEFSVASMSSSGPMRNYAIWLLLATGLCVVNCHRVSERRKPHGVRSTHRGVVGSPAGQWIGDV